MKPFKASWLKGLMKIEGIMSHSLFSYVRTYLYLYITIIHKACLYRLNMLKLLTLTGLYQLNRISIMHN